MTRFCWWKDDYNTLGKKVDIASAAGSGSVTEAIDTIRTMVNQELPLVGLVINCNRALINRQ